MPTHYLAIDVGSTTVTAVIIDLDSKTVVGSSSAPNTAEITTPDDKKIGRSDWDFKVMTGLAVNNAATLIQRTGTQPAAIGVTGQQQGLQLLDSELDTVGEFISWQDQRSKDLIPGEIRTYLDLMGEIGGAVVEDGGLPAFENTGCPLVTGYTAPNLFWLKANGLLPANDPNIHGTTAPEFVVSRLTGERPVTDPTDALSWGVYDVNRLNWDFGLIDTLGLDRSLFSNLGESCTVAGRLTNKVATQLGAKTGIPVAVASGDHQCSFAGTVIDYANTVAVNIGTGGQASIHVEKPIPRGWLELRPFIQSGYLLAGVGVVGGRTFRTLRDFFNNASRLIAGYELDPDVLYARLVELAAEVPAGAEGVHVDPLFTGSRSNPLAKAAFSELTPGTFTPGHMARALFEAMAAQLADSYREAARLGAGERSTLVGSGNGVKLNPVLRESLEAEFGMPIQLGAHNEEAAVGAALCAAVADGAFSSIAEASASFVNE
ncbi:MAG: FGGY family carbohydrate kinase [Dehalococcoidia bacterium]|jgi:sugar (pentulose or hexulose) kinase|nr:FGGY family carbohydrate kinase [Dehalococcoidia bacterium]